MSSGRKRPTSQIITRSKSKQSKSQPDPQPQSENSICIRFEGIHVADVQKKLGHKQGYGKPAQTRLEEFYKEMKKSLAYKPRNGKLLSWEVKDNMEVPEDLLFRKYTYGPKSIRILAVINPQRRFVVIWAINDHDGNYHFHYKEYLDIISLWERGLTTENGVTKITRPEPNPLPR